MTTSPNAAGETSEISMDSKQTETVAVGSDGLLDAYVDVNELQRNGYFGRARAEYLRRASLLPDGPTKKLCLKRAEECLAQSTNLANKLIEISERNSRATQP